MDMLPTDPKNAAAKVWVADTSKVKTSGKDQGLKYKVTRTKLAAESTVPCIPFDRMLKDKDAMKDRMVNTTGARDFKVTYVSYKGRAFQCKLTKDVKVQGKTTKV